MVREHIFDFYSDLPYPIILHKKSNPKDNPRKCTHLFPMGSIVVCDICTALSDFTIAIWNGSGYIYLLLHTTAEIPLGLQQLWFSPSTEFNVPSRPNHNIPYSCIAESPAEFYSGASNASSYAIHPFYVRRTPCLSELPWHASYEHDAGFRLDIDFWTATCNEYWWA